MGSVNQLKNQWKMENRKWKEDQFRSNSFFSILNFKFSICVFLVFIATTSHAMGNSQGQDNTQNNPGLDQAKKDYAVLLQELGEMGRQYSQVTAEAKKVIKEEGVPVWDDKAGTIIVSHDVNFTGTGPVTQTDREIKYVFEKPGLKKGSIRVTIEDDKTLHIQAFKRSMQDGQPDDLVDEKYELPTIVSDPRPQARYEDGVLTVTIQKPNFPKKTVSVPVQ